MGGAFAKAALIMAGLTAVGVGGYFGNQYLTCQGLEADYLNSVSKLKSYTLTMGLLQDKPAVSGLKSIPELEMKKLELTAFGLREQCGGQAADAAMRKGTEILLP